mgnify:CR=1 FL=1
MRGGIDWRRGAAFHFDGKHFFYRDDGAKINSLKSERASLDDWATFV